MDGLQNAEPSHNRKLGTLITAVALLSIAVLTLVPTQQSATVPMLCLACGPLGGVDLTLNVLLFIPLGVGLRLQSKGVVSAVAIGLLVTLIVELLQWRVVPGRDASVGDIFANVLGTAAGAWIGGRLSLWWGVAGDAAAQKAVQYALVASATALVVATLLQPARSYDPYAVQWRRVLENTDAFTARVVWAALNSRQLKPAELLRSVRWADGDSISTSVGVSGTIRPVRRRAEILRIGNPRSEAMLLGQRGNTIVFRAFTQAERLRLRSPLIGLPLSSAGETGNEGITGDLVFLAQSTPRELRLSISPGADTVAVSLPRTIGLAWTLFAPWEVVMGPRWWPANAISLALLVLPASFLASRARTVAPVAKGFASAGAVLMILVTIAAVPLVTGLSQLTSGEWGGVFVGLLAGHGIARVPIALTARA